MDYRPWALLAALAFAVPGLLHVATAQDAVPAATVQAIRATVKKARALKTRHKTEADLSGLQGREPLPNLHKVNDGILRSGQPSEDGLKQLHDQGVRTVLYLREDDGALERAAAEKLGMGFERASMSNFHAPSAAQADQALAVLKDTAKRPVLVHCRHGKDRTGFVVAAFRVTVDGWPIDKAVQEAKSVGCCAFTFGDLGRWLQSYKTHADGASPGR